MFVKLLIDSIEIFYGVTHANRKKIHLENWNQVCRNMGKSGLGLKKTMNQNLALLSKFGWNLKTKYDCLWVDLIKKKYLRNHTVDSWPRERAASHTWRSIKDTNHIVQSGTKWSIGNGQGIDLWNDWWCGEGPLAKKIPRKSC